MSHDPHYELPPGEPRPLLFSGCDECRLLGLNPGMAISHLDTQRFADAWQRAADFGRDRLAFIDAAELPILGALWGVQCQLERRGIDIGVVPGIPQPTFSE